MSIPHGKQPPLRSRPRVLPTALWVRSAAGTSKWHIAADRRHGARYRGGSGEFTITRCGQVLGEVIDAAEYIERRGVAVRPVTPARICDDCENIAHLLRSSRPR